MLNQLNPATILEPGKHDKMRAEGNDRFDVYGVGLSEGREGNRDFLIRTDRRHKVVHDRLKTFNDLLRRCCDKDSRNGIDWPLQ